MNNRNNVQRMLERQKERYEAELNEMRRLLADKIESESSSRSRGSSTSRNGERWRHTPSHPPSSSAAGHSRRSSSTARFPQNWKSRNSIEDHEEFNCPTCKKKFGLRVYQCSEGHSSCAECRIRGIPCGVCKGTITDMRNITLEGFLADFQGDLKCPNAAEGCYLHFKLVEMEAHLKECVFSEILCPYNAVAKNHCSWIGRAMEIDKHFSSAHADDVMDGQSEAQIYIGLDCYKIHLINRPPFKFLLFIKIEVPHGVSMAVQMVGTGVSAKKWSYDIQVFDKAEQKRKLQYSDVCLSHSTSMTTVFNVDNRGLVLQWTSAMSYADEGLLKYKLILNKK